MYFHPMLPLALERMEYSPLDGSVVDRWLVAFTSDLSRVRWFDRREDYLWLAADVAANPSLLRAMSAEMYEAFCAEEETEEAAACEARAEAWWDDLAHERVYAHVWPTGVF